ncbi:MAG: AmmeMemoRadiSam system protein B [Bifidobacteriaceae bacterium]|jgi:AmmeMemoRadiSam system protein B|nr:AmmeMemoRadiSam system protein B [Bifidobacteriaceae bacterium]
MALVRKPAVAGTFYPAAADELAAQVQGLLEDGARALDARPQPVGEGSRIKALIAPHAGYIYSGPTAGIAYAALRGLDYDQVVLLGPCHYASTPLIALAGVEYFRTPLGDVPVWEEGVARVGVLPEIITSPEVHRREHSLEVHLPFIQTALGPDIPVLPLAVGWAESGAVATMIDSVYGDPKTLVVISSDLSHYLPYWNAIERDERTIARMLGASGEIKGEDACGVYPVNGWREIAHRRGLAAHLLDYRNSGDTAGDKNAVVGYAAIQYHQAGGR